MVKFRSFDDRIMTFEGYTLHLELDLYPAGSLLRESPTLATQLRRPKNLADWISSQHNSIFNAIPREIMLRVDRMDNFDVYYGRPCSRKLDANKLYVTTDVLLDKLNIFFYDCSL